MSIHRDVALAALDAGISVVPPRQDGSKAPLGSWERYQRELPSPRQMRAWYDGERTGVGFVCGAVSGGLECFELEGRFVAAGGDRRFIELAEAEGLSDLVHRLCTGYWSRSPSSGWHWLYRCEQTACLKLAYDAEGGLLIETKGEGGYIIEAPTNGRVHPSGGEYKMLAGGIDTIPTISAEDRHRLLELASRFNERIPEPPGVEDTAWRTIHASEGWVSVVVDDYNARSTWVEELASIFEHLYDRAGIGYWHFGGAENHVSATTNATGRDTLIIFSGTAQGRGWRGSPSSYDRFSARVFRDTGSHAIDARIEVARRLRAEGYGPQALRGNAGASVQTDDTRLPEEFWLPPRLTQIHQAARARQRSPELVLHVVLARLAASCPYTLRLPPIVGSAVSLCYFVAGIGRTGAGKSSAARIGRELLIAPDWVADNLPVGSGEGLAEVLFDVVCEPQPGGKSKAVKRQVRHNAYVYADEGSQVFDIGRRKGAILLSTIRSMWLGEAIGQTNATAETKRIVPAGSYVYGIVLGLQPSSAAGLIEDADAGTPARFAFAAAGDPTLPDEPPSWPGPVRWEPSPVMHEAGALEIPASVAAEVRRADLELQRKGGSDDPLAAHEMALRLKMAALLGALECPEYRGFTEDDWERAGMLKARSDAVRAELVAAVDAAAERREAGIRQRHAARQSAADNATRQIRTVDAARAIAAKVWREPERWTVKALQQSMSRWVREVWSEALDHAFAERWVVEIDEPGQGADKRCLRPGERRP